MVDFISAGFSPWELLTSDILSRKTTVQGAIEIIDVSIQCPKCSESLFRGMVGHFLDDDSITMLSPELN